jgi:hypothetical protein
MGLTIFVSESETTMMRIATIAGAYRNVHILCEWEAKEREMELFPRTISQQTHSFFMDVGLLKFYEEGTYLKENSSLLQHLIYHWDRGQQVFRVSLDPWYHPKEEDVYFIIGLYRRGEAFP